MYIELWSLTQRAEHLDMIKELDHIKMVLKVNGLQILDVQCHTAHGKEEG